jgi:hypothetical protein
MAPRSSKKEPDAASGTPNKHDRVTRGSPKTPPSAASIDSQKTSEAALKKSAKRTLPEDTTKENSPKKKAPTHQVLTERDDIPRLWSDEQAAKNGSYSTWHEVTENLDVFDRRDAYTSAHFSQP